MQVSRNIVKYNILANSVTFMYRSAGGQAAGNPGCLPALQPDAFLKCGLKLANHADVSDLLLEIYKMVLKRLPATPSALPALHLRAHQLFRADPSAEAALSSSTPTAIPTGTICIFSALLLTA